MHTDPGDRSVDLVDRVGTEHDTINALTASVRRLIADDEVPAARRTLDELLGALATAYAGLGALARSAEDADEATWPDAVDDLLVAIEHLTG